MSRRREQRGFTLVELVVVIAVLGILAAVALPRFTDLQVQARTAKANALLGSVRAASAVSKAQALANNTSCVAYASGSSPTITSEGQTIQLAYCYPTSLGITTAANISAANDGITLSAVTDSSASVDIQVNGAGGTALANCKVTYTAATSATVPPVITATTSGC